MAGARTLVAIVHGVVVGLIGALSLLWVDGGTCTATDFLFSHPLHAFAGAPPDHYGESWLGIQCAVDPSPLRTWLMLWGPMSVATAVAGAFTIHKGGMRMAGSIAGAVVGLTWVLLALLSDLLNHPAYSIPTPRVALVSVVLVLISAALGLVGAAIMKRHA